MTVKTWEITEIPGDGRGGPFWNTPESYTDERSGLKILDWDGYDEDEDFDDFGHEIYHCRCEGTLDQVNEFLEIYFDGEGEIEEE